MKHIFSTFFALCVFSSVAFAQGGISVNTTGTTPDPSAMFDVQSTTKGILIPRMTEAQRNTIASPATGLMVYQTDNTAGFYYYNGSSWQSIGSASFTETDPKVATTTTGRLARWNGTALADGLLFDNGMNIGLGTTSPADKLHVVGNARIETGRIDVRNTANSVLIGEGAGTNDDFTTAKGSVAVGKNALMSNISAAGNTAIGYEALRSTTTNSNTAVGYFSMRKTTTGAWNAALGQNSLVENTTGRENTAIGGQAMFSNISGSYNTAIGTDAMLNKTSGDYNVALGALAGANNTMGSYNIFLGNQAGQNETGSNKLYIDNSNTASPLIWGDFATNLLRVNGTLNVNNAYSLPTVAGSANQFLQTNGAGVTSWVTPSFLTTESDPKVGTLTTNYLPKWNGTTLANGLLFDNGTNVGLGTTSPTDKLHVVGNLSIDGGKLPFYNTGQSVFIGEGAGINDNLANRQNVFVGYNAGNLNTTGNLNTFVGHASGSANTTGFWNTALGQNALGTNTTGNYNTAIGRSTLGTNTTGSFNTALGERALGNNTTGSNNLALGGSALSSLTSTSNNIALGVGSLASNTSGANNVVIGHQAGSNNITGSGNLLLGYQAGQNETGSDKLYIDNSNTASPLIFGDFSSNLLRVNGTLNVNNAYNLPTVAGTANQFLQTNGAGVTSWVTPSFLSTESDPKVGSLTTNYLPKWNGTSLANGLLFDNGTNIGLGTTSPTSRLHITHNGTNPAVLVESGSNQYPLALNIAPTTHTTSRRAALSLDDWYVLQDVTGTGTKDFAIYQASANQHRLSISTSGNVGIGTSSPTQRLDVAGTTRTTNLQMTTGATNGFVLQSDASGNAAWVNPTTLPITESDPKVGTLTTNYLPKWNGTSLANGLLFDDGTNVGLGTASPADKLHVVGKLRIDAGKIDFRNTGQSVFIGENAGANDDLNNRLNVFVGYNAGNANTTGYFNTALGHNALASNTTAVANVAVGRNSLSALTTGSSNTSIGENSGISLTTGNANVIVGSSTFRLSNGTSNVIVGFAAGYNHTSGNDNTYLGYQTGYNSITGAKNVFLGYNAGYNETGSNRLYIANSDTPSPLIYGEFDNNLLRINGTLNINNAYNLPTTAGTNGFVLQTNGTGVTNWVDASTLSITESDPKVGSLTTNYLPKWNGTSLANGLLFDDGTNVGLGTASPADKLHVVGKLRIDAGKIDFRNTGNSVFIGQDAGANDDLTANNNVAIGFEALKANTSGSLNVGVGYQALTANTLGVNNVALGYGAGKAITGSDNNVFIGTNAGTSNTSDGNVFIGNNAGLTNSTGSNNVFIGNNVGTAETGSNKLYIDNSNTTAPLIWGDFSSNYVNINGNLGIGTNTPSTKFHVYNGDGRLDRGANTAGVGRIFTINGARSGQGSNFAQLNFENYDNNNGLVDYVGASIGSQNTGSIDAGDLRFSTNNGTLTERMIISKDGYVGIGTSTPTQAMLVVNGSQNTTITNYGYLNTAGSGVFTGTGTNGYSIYASSRIAATEFNAYSDARIKKIKGITNNAQDLATLANIRITDYKHIDSIAKGNGEIKKVIAQELKTVYPQAVSTMTDVVPDIYQQASIENGFVNLPTNLKAGEKVKIIFATGEEVLEVTSVQATGFKVNSDKVGKVFVFGRQVDDFHVVDYEALSTLNISATQELLKRIEALEHENKTLKSQNQEMQNVKAEVTDLKKQMQEIQMLLQQSAKK